MITLSLTRIIVTLLASDNEMLLLGLYSGDRGNVQSPLLSVSLIIKKYLLSSARFRGQ